MFREEKRVVKASRATSAAKAASSLPAYIGTSGTRALPRLFFSMMAFRFGKRSEIVRTALLVACFAVPFVTTDASEHHCSATQSQPADAAVDKIQSWDRLYKWYKLYLPCDDGGPAESISEAVARNLIDRWEPLGRSAQLAKNVPRFGAFVLKHIDATLDENDLRKIDSNASTRCPTGLGSLCDSVRKKTGSS